ncbi:MAG TPA: sigma-70 family RNA polymerase sigma factor [Myxococcota bacterium]|nr:sigma-70 family RNA polymerase sigma factor [Myxococcota bacterium]
MLAFQAGDRRAFDELFARYTPRLHSFLTRMVRDRGRAEELTQDVFIRLYTAAERYEARTRFSTYVFGIAHNLALNHLARAWRQREQSLGEGAPEPASDAAGPAEQLDAARTHAALERALGGLPERQRAALLLRTQEDMGYEEIAAALGTSVPSVKSLLHRAREALLARLGKADP